METLATVYFDLYRTYIALIERKEGGACLSYLHATAKPLDVTASPENIGKSDAIYELERVLISLAGKADAFAVSFSMNAALAYSIPFASAAQADERREFIAFEMRQHCDASGVSDAAEFEALAQPLAEEAESAFAVFIPPGAIAAAHYMASLIGCQTLAYGIDQIDAHAAMLHNYPEHENSALALCGLQGDYADVSFVRGTELLRAATFKLDEHSTLGSLLAEGFKDFADREGLRPEAAFFFGTDLTKARLDDLARALPFPAHRLNPLRRISTTLSDREREYCSRIAHVLAPCVGSAFASRLPLVRFH